MKAAYCLFILPLLAAGVARAAPPPAPISAQEMVVQADKVRNPGQAYRFANTLREYVDGKLRNSTGLVAFSKWNGKASQYDNLIYYAQPARDKGKLVLMAGSKMYFFDPASKATVRLSPQQRLLGQAANGDVMTVNLAHDYNASLMAREVIQDGDKAARDCWELDLAAAGPDAAYRRVELWVEVGSYRPIKGKYYADSGRLLKVAFFRAYRQELGGVRPTESVIIDGVDPSQVTTMTFSDYRYQNIPDAWFQREYMQRVDVN